MDEDLPYIKYQTYPWIPEINTAPKLIHATLVPLSLHKEFSSAIQIDNNDLNSNNNENEQMSTKVEPIHPFVTRIAKLKILNRNTSKRLSRVNSKRKQKRISVIIPRQQRVSQIFRQNLLEQSVLLSFDSNITTGNPQFNPDKNFISINDNNNSGENGNINNDEGNNRNNNNNSNSINNSDNKKKLLRRQTLIRKSVIEGQRLKKRTS
jgi:hypothetical protein